MSKPLPLSFNDVFTLIRHHTALSACVVAASIAVALVTMLPTGRVDWWVFACLFVVGSIAGFAMHARRFRDVMADASSATRWVPVYRSSKLCGQIREDVLATAQQSLLLSPRLFVQQARNVARVAWVLLDDVLRMGPVIAFWLCLGLFLYNPSAINQGIDTLRDYTPSQAMGALTIVHFFMWILGMMVIALRGPGRYGFSNEYNDALNTAVMRLGNVARTSGDWDRVGFRELASHDHAEDSTTWWKPVVSLMPDGPLQKAGEWAKANA